MDQVKEAPINDGLDPQTEKAPTARLPRDPSIDVMKGIGMILVIITHMQAKDLLGYSFVAYVMTWIMPMYFFITGYLHSGSSDVKLGFGRYLVKKLRTIGLPYLIFFAVGLLWMQTVYAYALGATAFAFPFEWPPFLDAFVLAGRYLFENPFTMTPLWFLHGLFFASLVFYFIMKIKRRWVLLVIALALAAVTVPIESALSDNPVWLLRLLPPALFYMVTGHLFRGVVTDGVRARMQKGIALPILVPLACMIVGFFIMKEARGDMWEIKSYLYFAGSLFSIFGCYVFSQGVQSRQLQFVGSNSLLYLGLHGLILMLPFFEGLPAWFASCGFDGFVIFLGYFAVSFMAETLLVQVARWLQMGYRSAFRPRERDKTAIHIAE